MNDEETTRSDIGQDVSSECSGGDHDECPFELDGFVFECGCHQPEDDYNDNIHS